MFLVLYRNPGDDEVDTLLAHQSDRSVRVADTHDIIAFVDEHISDQAPEFTFVRDDDDDRYDGHGSNLLAGIHVGKDGRVTRMRKREHLIRLRVGTFHPRGAGWHAGDRDPC